MSAIATSLSSVLKPPPMLNCPVGFSLTRTLRSTLSASTCCGQNFDGLEEIQIIQALKAPLERGGIDDVLLIDAQLAADDVVLSSSRCR